MIHRIVDKLCRSKRRPKVPSEVELLKMGKHCSITERRAERAERELKKLKLLTYMKGCIGDELTAVITGVESFGFFCQGIDIPAEGLVHISSLADDHYQYDQASYSLNGFKAGNQFRLGDRIKVAVARVDLERRSLDYKLIKAAKRSGDDRRRSPRRTKKVGDTRGAKKSRTKSKSGAKKKRRTRKRRR